MSFERRALGDGHILICTPLEDAGFLAAFTERNGGVSATPYDSRNLAFHVGDDDGAVRANRRAVCTALGIDGFAVADQVHGTTVAEVGQSVALSGFAGQTEAFAGTDAMITSSSGVAMALLAADCVPLVAASRRSGVLVVAHCGWRGVAGGMTAIVADMFDDRKDVIVALGPAIGPDHYEVGEDVASAVGDGTRTGAVIERRNGAAHLDLVATIRAELASFGIRNVHDTGLCTACEPDRFFSFRREGVTGRHAAVAMRVGGER
jgi:YfiH family protein